MSSILVSHVSFGERGLEIGYSEERDRGDQAMLFRTIVIDNDLVADEIEDLRMLVQQIVDRGLETILNPPTTTSVRPLR